MNENKVEIVYFRKKLGISFKIIDGNVCVVGSVDGFLANPQLSTLNSFLLASELKKKNDVEPAPNSTTLPTQSKHDENSISIPTAPPQPTILTENEASNHQPIMGGTLGEEKGFETVYLGASATYGELSFVGSSNSLTNDTTTNAPEIKQFQPASNNTSEVMLTAF